MKKITRFVTNFFVITYLCIIYFSAVPASNTLNSRLKDKALDIAFLIGVWPSWSMFAPNPIKNDSKTYAEIMFKDGQKKEFDIEQKPKGMLSILRKARWMKFSQDNLGSPHQKGLLHPTLNFQFEKYNSIHNPITSIALKRKWWNVPVFPLEGAMVSISSTIHRPMLSEVLITKSYKD